MAHFGVALGFLLALTTGAMAQDEPLPDSVARAYLAYENAMTAEDYLTASEAAETAWRAARSERIDAELIGILAENYGNLALSRGQPERAYPAWRNAAEISDRLRASQSERANRWYRAALSAFATGELRDARQCSIRASRAAAASEAPIEAGLSGDIHYMVAATSGRLGRLNTMAEHATLALQDFEASGHPFDLVYANAYYLSAVGRYFENDRAGSVFEFHMARGIYAAAGVAGHMDDIRTSSFWLHLARQAASAEELALLDARIAESAFPETEFPGVWPDAEAAGHVYEVDAIPESGRRRPEYPHGAAAADIDGIVLVRFDVTEAGRTDAARIIAAAPGGIFEDVSLRAIRSWRYEPAMNDGLPVRREGVLTQFQFTMCDLPTARACRLRQEAEEAD